LADVREPEAYAVVILRNVCFNQIRDKKPTVELYDTIMFENNSLSRQIDTLDNANYLMKLMADLPEQQRVVVTLKDVEGYSFKEIEEITGTNVENLRVILSRARKKLREQFIKTEQR